MLSAKQIIDSQQFDFESLVALLGATGHNRRYLFEKAASTKTEYVGNKVYFRGLIELSNICSKDCLYCGIRRSNQNTQRYFIPAPEVLEAATFALEHGYGSIVIQSGERSDRNFVESVSELLRSIKGLSNGQLGITLSMGEQTQETYQKWFEAGAHRYLMRIETSNRELYYKIHPNDRHHSYDERLKALHLLKKIGYNVGTGVMIGLPFQTIEDLARDLLFFRELDIDMAGMGPYVEHQDTPLYHFRDQLLPKAERFDLALKMVAILRIMMKDVNIAATTAMQAIDKMGREKALKVGANIIMPNLTPVKYRDGYLLYEDKPCIDEEADECQNCLEARIHLAGDSIGYHEWGDSKHFANRQKSE